MNRFDVQLAHKNFSIKFGTLYRRLAGGNLAPLRTLDHGKLVVVAEGQKLQALDVAWALHYGNWPKFQLISLDGDPYNMSQENLMAIRLRKYRERFLQVDGRWKHALDQHATFATRESCARDWKKLVNEKYLNDLPYILQIEADERLAFGKPSVEARITLPMALARVKELEAQLAALQARKQRPESPQKRPERPPMPLPIAGKVWCWHISQWIAVAPPVHVSDDWTLRCAAALNGQSVVFDPALQRTVPENATM